MNETHEGPAIKFYVAAALSFWALGFIAMYVHSFYFGGSTFDQLFSFKAGDLPGNLQTGCTTNPFGNHYFGDLTSVLCHSKQDSPYFSAVPTNYFPFAYIVLRPLLQVFKAGIGITAAVYFSIFVTIITLTLLRKYQNIKAETKIIIILSIFLAQPFLQMIDRGNNQLVVLSMLFVGLYFSSKGSKFIGPFCLGIAIALKLYPIIFALRFVQQRRWFELFITIKTTVLLTLMSLLLFDRGVISNLVEMLSDINNYRDIRHTSLSYNNSMMALLNSLLQLDLNFFGLVDLFVDNYLYVIAPPMMLITYVLCSTKLTEFENSVLGAVFCTLFIELSPSYVFTMFLLPLMFLEELKTLKPTTYLVLMAIAFIMAPKNLPLLDAANFGDVATVGSIFNPLAVVLILLSTIIGAKTQKISVER
jgi:energy-converting hydrogenase Eha subunit C